jgi:hypothetical protein
MEPDAGDTFATAEKVGSRTTVTDDFDSRRDIDVFRFRLAEGEAVELTTVTPNNRDPDTVLALYNSQGQLIAFDDDSGSGLESELLFTNSGPADRFFVVASAFNRSPDDAVDEGDLSGPDYSGRGGAEDLNINYSINLNFFEVI